MIFGEAGFIFELTQNDKSILNLASKEYSKVIEKYLTPEVEYVSCIFGIWQDGKVKVKATEAKMAVVKWCAGVPSIIFYTLKTQKNLTG